MLINLVKLEHITAIDVEVRCGAHVPKAIQEMLDLANLLGILVRTRMNGVDVEAKPGDNFDDLRREFSAAVK